MEMKKKLYEHTLAELLLEKYRVPEKEREFKTAVEELRSLGFSYTYLEKFYDTERKMRTSELIEDLEAMAFVIEETRRAEEGAKLITAAGAVALGSIIGVLAMIDQYTSKKFGPLIGQKFIVPVINLISNMITGGAPSAIDAWNLADKDRLVVKDIAHYIGFDDDVMTSFNSEQVSQSLTDKEYRTNSQVSKKHGTRGVLNQLYQIKQAHDEKEAEYNEKLLGTDEKKGRMWDLFYKEGPPPEQLWTMDDLQNLTIDTHTTDLNEREKLKAHKKEHELLDWSAIKKDLEAKIVPPGFTKHGKIGPSSLKSIRIGFDRWFRGFDDVVYNAFGLRPDDQFLSDEDNEKIAAIEDREKDAYDKIDDSQELADKGLGRNKSKSPIGFRPPKEK